MDAAPGMFYGVGFDPLESAPAILALIVALFVWRRHRVDRRARLFLALAASELAFGIPLLITTLRLPESHLGIAAIDGFILGAGLLSATIFLHFGLAFPHARPWLRRGNIKVFYLAAALVGLAPIAAVAISPAAQEKVQDAMAGTWAGIGLLVLSASGVACVSIYRSYREMTADERRRYRVPVFGVLLAMIAGVAVDLMLGLMFGTLFGTESRYMMWTANVLATAAKLLLPLFFFMAAVKVRLLERHAQDYVLKL
jgi:hypothetical protein